MKINFICFKRLLSLFVVCCFLFAGRAKAQTSILVTYYNGTEQGYSVATTGKLYFENGNLQIAISSAATPVSIPVSIIRKVTFAAAPLPLRMLDFTVVNEKAQVTLFWKTENEVNTSHFVVERSADGVTYESIGQVTSLNGTANSYRFADAAPKTGVSYYRLKQVDADGKYEYSKVLTVKRSTSDIIITLLPNPATDYIQINSTTTERLAVKIYAADGRLMITGTFTPGEQIAISKLTPGLYLATINDKTYKLIKH